MKSKDESPSLLTKYLETMMPIDKLAIKDFSCKQDYDKSLTKRLNDYLEEIC
jgi:hypothetical protein